MDAGYQTAAREAEDAFVERRSRFIGAICPVQTEEDALAFVAKRKKAHWDATHHVYAYVLRQGGIRRYSDDGEPQGTAGMPVLDVLLKEALSDCVVVVTRYFGGILLGGGGLVRAYSHGASLAVAAGGLQVMRLCDIVRLSCSYGQYGWVAPLIAEQGGVLDDTIFTDTVELAFHLPLEQTEPLQAALTEKSAGALSLAVEERRYFSFESKKMGQNR